MDLLCSLRIHFTQFVMQHQVSMLRGKSFPFTPNYLISLYGGEIKWKDQ